MTPSHSLPEGWEIKPLGDPSLATINPLYPLTGGPYPFVPMDAVANGFGGIAYFESVDEASGGYCRFREGDVLLAKITPCAENGKVALVEGIGDGLGLGSTEFHVISPAEGVNSRFIYYLFSSGHVHKLAVSLMEGTTGRQRIPASIFKKRLAAPVPLDGRERGKIADILGAVDSAIAATKASIEVARKLKKGLMQNLLTGRLKLDGTWRREDEFYVDPKFGRVPKGWMWTKVKENLAEPATYGANAPAIPFDESLPRFLRITDIDDDGNLLESGKASVEIAGNNSYELEAGDFLIARTGDTVGKSLLYTHEMGRCAFAGYLIRLRFDAERLLPEYFNLVAHSDFFEAFKVAMRRVGAKPNINAREYSNFTFPKPKLIEEQQSIVAVVKNLNAIATLRREKQAKLQKLKKSLMQHLLTGKVRVPMD